MRMQESKENDGTGEFEGPHEDSSDLSSGLPAGNAADADGWQQYRRWISKAPAPRSRRGSVDPSLYTWKGYRNWTEQVKRNWSDN